MKEEEAPKYDFSVLELEEDIGKKYGWIGIDTRNKNTQKIEEIEICGYPSDKEAHTMWHAQGKFIDSDFFFSYQIQFETGYDS